MVHMKPRTIKNRRNETPIATIEGIIKKKIGKMLAIMR